MGLPVDGFWSKPEKSAKLHCFVSSLPSSLCETWQYEDKGYWLSDKYVSDNRYVLGSTKNVPRPVLVCEICDKRKPI